MVHNGGMPFQHCSFDGRSAPSPSSFEGDEPSRRSVPFVPVDRVHSSQRFQRRRIARRQSNAVLSPPSVARAPESNQTAVTHHRRSEQRRDRRPSRRRTARRPTAAMRRRQVPEALMLSRAATINGHVVRHLAANTFADLVDIMLLDHRRRCELPHLSEDVQEATIRLRVREALIQRLQIAITRERERIHRYERGPLRRSVTSDVRFRNQSIIRESAASDRPRPLDAITGDRLAQFIVDVLHSADGRPLPPPAPPQHHSPPPTQRRRVYANAARVRPVNTITVPASPCIHNPHAGFGFFCEECDILGDRLSVSPWIGDPDTLGPYGWCPRCLDPGVLGDTCADCRWECGPQTLPMEYVYFENNAERSSELERLALQALNTVRVPRMFTYLLNQEYNYSTRPIIPPPEPQVPVFPIMDGVRGAVPRLPANRRTATAYMAAVVRQDHAPRGPVFNHVPVDDSHTVASYQGSLGVDVTSTLDNPHWSTPRRVSPIDTVRRTFTGYYWRRTTRPAWLPQWLSPTLQPGPVETPTPPLASEYLQHIADEAERLQNVAAAGV